MPHAVDLKALKTELIQPYSPPSYQRLLRHEMLNAAVNTLADVLVDVCPNSPTAEKAMYALVDARMWANHAIAVGGDSRDSTEG